MLALYLRIRNLFVREDGQDMVEYALLIALISIVAIVAIRTAGEAVETLWGRVTDALASAGL